MIGIGAAAGLGAQGVFGDAAGLVNAMNDAAFLERLQRAKQRDAINRLQGCFKLIQAVGDHRPSKLPQHPQPDRRRPYALV